MKDTNTKYHIGDELESIQQKIINLEGYTKKHVKARTDQRKVLRALVQVEKGLVKALKILGEG